MFFIYKGKQLKQKNIKMLKIISKAFRKIFPKLLDEKKSLLILL